MERLNEAIAAMGVALKAYDDVDLCSLPPDERAALLLDLTDAQKTLTAVGMWILALPTEAPDHGQGAACIR